jgi:hypothetical protein
MSQEKSNGTTQAQNSVACSAVFGVLVQRWWECTLSQCPPGLFLHGDDLGFKTEYSDVNGSEAYVVASGEYFWGGTNDREVRRNIKVTPVIINMKPNELSHSGTAMKAKPEPQGSTRATPRSCASVSGSARTYECPGCGERKTQDRFPDDPAVPGLCAACDLLVRSDDEPLENAHRAEAPNDRTKPRRATDP